MSLTSLPAQQLLKRTRSRCPVCHAACPAEVWKIGDAPAKVFLTRTCPTHGAASVCISSDARFYWLAQGNPANAAGACGCGPGGCSPAEGSRPGTLGRNADPGDALGAPEKLSTCLALIELVHSCNLACPTCYADSPVGAGGHVDAVPLADLQRRIQGVIDRKGEIEILQLSGGEPTLHPQFFEFLEWAQAHPKLGYLLLNTNGVRLAQDDAFADRLAKTFRYGKFQLYLQFDGPQEAGQRNLRGADLRALRERALERCRAMNLPVTLAMTVTPENLGHLWEAIEFGLRWENVRGISFQPAFTSGRFRGIHPPVPDVRTKASDGLPMGSDPLPGEKGGSPQRLAGLETGLASLPERLETLSAGFPTLPTPSATRLNTADLILACVEQSRGQLRFEDFTPLPCGDPNCATIGYLLKVGGEIRSVSDFVDFSEVQGFLRDKIRYQLADLAQCGCESEPLGALLKQFELDERSTFRLFIKPFMDAATWDEDRIDRCCTHVIRPDGKLDSFCRYYSGFADAKP